MTLLPLALWLAGCAGPEEPAPPAPLPAAPVPVAEPLVIVPNEPLEDFTLSKELPGGFPDLRVPGAVQFPLTKLAGEYEISPRKYPPKVEATNHVFELDIEEVPNPRNAPRTLNVVRATLPFPVASDEQTFGVQGMSVTAGGKPLAFSKRPAPQADRDTWRVKGKDLVMSLAELPADGKVQVTYDGPRRALDRHDLERSGLEPSSFVQYSVTLAQHTRHGLMLPAPAAARWPIRLPEGARFETWLALEEPPLSKPRSDGAVAVLALTIDGQRTEVARQDFPDQGTFLPWQVDLSPYAGKEVTLELTVDPKENPTFDWCFFGSPAVSGTPLGEVRRIVVIGLDTTRADHIGFNGYPRESTPELDAFAASAAVFDAAWTPAPRTRPSFRSATTGRRPLDAVNATNIGEVFQRSHFATAGIVANPHLQPRFGFDQGFDSWQFDGRADAAGQVDLALDWLGSHTDRDTYLFLHFMDAHMIYDAPGEWRNRYVTEEDPDLPRRVERAKVLQMMKAGQLSDRARVQLEALHDGEMAYMSHEIGRLVDALDAMPGRTLVVVHSDHGEEFWDHGGFEHNHSLYDELVRAVLWVRPGGGMKPGVRYNAPATLADIGPTLYDFAGIKDPPPTDGRSLVPVIAGKADWAERAIPIGYLQYAHERWGVVYKGHKYVVHTGSGEEELYDLNADPGEKVDKAATTDLAPWRSELVIAHSITAGPGWRVRIDLRSAPAPLEIGLPEGVVAAGVLDPEAVVEHRANIEWGETPRRTPEAIGRAQLSEDRRTLTFTPGDDPEGILFVVFEGEQTPQAAQLKVGGASVEMSHGKNGRVWKDGARSVVVDPGFVVVPPPTEAQRMGLGGSVSISDLQMLCELGYVQGAQCDDLH